MWSRSPEEEGASPGVPREAGTARPAAHRVVPGSQPTKCSTLGLARGSGPFEPPTRGSFPLAPPSLPPLPSPSPMTEASMAQEAQRRCGCRWPSWTRGTARRGRTLLHWVAKSNTNPDVITFLLEQGADLTLRDKLGWTPLHLVAGSNSNPKGINVLIERGADPNAQDKHGNTPLHMAARLSENPEIIGALLEAGADLNAPEPARGQTPLHFAANSNFDPEIVSYLLEAGADPTVQDNEGKTPLDLAEGDRSLKGTAAYRKLKAAR